MSQKCKIIKRFLYSTWYGFVFIIDIGLVRYSLYQQNAELSKFYTFLATPPETRSRITTGKGQIF